jgi:hypothetical protein
MIYGVFQSGIPAEQKKKTEEAEKTLQTGRFVSRCDQRNRYVADHTLPVPQDLSLPSATEGLETDADRNPASISWHFHDSFSETQKERQGASGNRDRPLRSDGNRQHDIAIY